MKNNRPRRWRKLKVAGAIVGALGMASPAIAQLGGLGRGLPSPLGQVSSALGRTTSRTLDALDPRTLLDQRLDRLDALVRAHSLDIERDDHGAPVVRGEVLAIAPTPVALEAARHAGFDVARDRDTGDAVGLIVLQSPKGVSARDAVKRMRKLDPSGVYDFNHLYEQSGEIAAPAKPGGMAKPSPGAPPSASLGLIDTGIDGGGGVFSLGSIAQKGFASVAPKPAAHGTAVASLMVGEAQSFRGGAPRASLYVADVYGDAPTGGSAEAIVRAFSWLADRKVKVINVSLVGPPNAALGAAVKSVQSRGVVIVAAVGNDGPAAPAAYPASYPDVVAVTGVDARGRVLIEAGTAQHLDFAAPGADMAAAGLGGGYVTVRGTSFASPLVAGQLAMLMHGDARSAVDRLAREATHNKAYGRGLVATDLRTPPSAVKARPFPRD